MNSKKGILYSVEYVFCHTFRTLRNSRKFSIIKGIIEYTENKFMMQFNDIHII